MFLSIAHEKQEDLLQYLAANKFDFQTIADPKAFLAGDVFHVLGYPTKMVIDRTGKIRYYSLGGKIDGDIVRADFRGFMLGEDKGYIKNEKLRAYMDISKVKGDGIMYNFLIKKSAGHLPESVDKIDFSKIIVTDTREHARITATNTFTNYVGLPNFSPKELQIGSLADNNTPSSAIGGEKAWANGEYYFGVVYTNKTYNMSAHYYIPLTIKGF